MFCCNESFYRKYEKKKKTVFTTERDFTDEIFDHRDCSTSVLRSESECHKLFIKFDNFIQRFWFFSNFVINLWQLDDPLSQFAFYSIARNSQLFAECVELGSRCFLRFFVLCLFLLKFLGRENKFWLVDDAKIFVLCFKQRNWVSHMFRLFDLLYLLFKTWHFVADVSY